MRLLKSKIMNYKELEKKLLKEYRVLWTDWKMLDNNKMRRVENKSAKSLIKMLIGEAFRAGLNRASEIINK